MKKYIPHILVISVLLNVIFVGVIYMDNQADREHKEALINKFVKRQKRISQNFKLLSQELLQEEYNRKEIFDFLKETEKLLEGNDDLYINSRALTSNVRAINMEGLGMMPTLWYKFQEGKLKEELPLIQDYHSLLEIYFSKIRKEHNFQNVDNPKQKTRVLEEVSKQLLHKQ